MTDGQELIKIMCDGSMKATALHLAQPSEAIKDNVSRINSMTDKYAWLSKNIKPIIMKHYQKFIEDMKDLVELEMMPAHNKEQWLQQSLNVTCNAVAVELIKTA